MEIAETELVNVGLLSVMILVGNPSVRFDVGEVLSCHSPLTTDVVIEGTRYHGYDAAKPQSRSFGT